MRYIEPHAHMVSRTTDDYERMALAGCEAVCEPAFWAGFDRSSPAGFFDYFCQLTDYEPKRAAKFGLKHFCWLCINSKEAEDVKLAEEVIALIPKLLNRPNVLGIGEIGLNKNSRNELRVLEMQVELAAKHGQLILGYRYDAARGAVNHRDGSSPVSLPRNAPIFDAERHRRFAEAVCFSVLGHPAAGLLAMTESKFFVMKTPVQKFFSRWVETR